jgi:hypothetical protein
MFLDIIHRPVSLSKNAVVKINHTVFLHKDRTDNVHKHNICLMPHRYKLSDLILYSVPQVWVEVQLRNRQIYWCHISNYLRATTNRCSDMSAIGMLRRDRAHKPSQILSHTATHLRKDMCTSLADRDNGLLMTRADAVNFERKAVPWSIQVLPRHSGTFRDTVTCQGTRYHTAGGYIVAQAAP